MIVNLNNGDDTTYYPSVEQAVCDTRKQGIFVVGYDGRTGDIRLQLMKVVK